MLAFSNGLLQLPIRKSDRKHRKLVTRDYRINYADRTFEVHSVNQHETSERVENALREQLGNHLVRVIIDVIVDEHTRCLQLLCATGVIHSVRIRRVVSSKLTHKLIEKLRSSAENCLLDDNIYA